MKTMNNLSKFFHIRNRMVLRSRSCLYSTAAFVNIVAAATSNDAARSDAATLDAVASC